MKHPNTTKVIGCTHSCESGDFDNHNNLMCFIRVTFTYVKPIFSSHALNANDPKCIF